MPRPRKNPLIRSTSASQQAKPGIVRTAYRDIIRPAVTYGLRRAVVPIALYAGQQLLNHYTAGHLTPQYLAALDPDISMYDYAQLARYNVANAVRRNIVPFYRYMMQPSQQRVFQLMD